MSGLTSKAKDGWARWKLAHFFLRDIQDVDVSTTLPTSGQTLLWNSTDNKWEPGSVGGFDPNENPVIIGAGATAGGGSTPSNLTGGTANAIAIGDSASASGSSGIAIGTAADAQANAKAIAIGRDSVCHSDQQVCIGYGPQAGWSNAIAIGSLADAATLSTNGGTDAIAIGSSSKARNNDCIALGDQSIAGTDNLTDVAAVAVGLLAHATAEHSVALGRAAVSAFAFATAVGPGATTTAARQIMLGGQLGFSETVQYDTTYGSIHVMQSPNGTRYALQVSNAGVLSTIASPV